MKNKKFFKKILAIALFALAAKPAVDWYAQTKVAELAEVVEVKKLQNLQVKDSYKYRMSEIIAYVDEAYADGRLDTSRSKQSYIEEWYAHNVLHAFNIEPKRTGSVDLDNKETKERLLCYKLIFWLASGTITYCMYR